MRPGKNIEEIIKQFDMEIHPDKDRRILDGLQQAHAAAKRSGPVFSAMDMWRIIMKSNMTKYTAAVAAMIVIGVSVFVVSLPSYAIAETVEAVGRIRNLRMSIVKESQTAQMLMQINSQTGHVDYIRMNEQGTGDVIITIPDQTYIYRKQQNQVTLLPQELLTNDLNFKDVINSLVEQTGAQGGRVIITKRLHEPEQKELIIAAITRADKSVAGEFLIDPDSKLPLYIGIEGADGTLNYMGPIEYDIPMPDDTFEFVIPDGAEVIDNRPEELKTKRPEVNQAFGFDLTETAAAMMQAYNVHGVWIDRKGRRVESWGLLNPHEGTVTRSRLEYEDGGLYIMNNGKTYFEDDGIAAVRDELFFNIGVIFKDFVAFAVQNVQEQDVMTVEKLYSDEFQQDVISVQIRRPWVHFDALIDPDTKRPISFSLPWTADLTEQFDYSELIEYNVDLPEGFFDVGTGPDVIVLGEHLDQQFCNDPRYGMPYEDAEDIQQVCRTLAARYLKAKMEEDVDTIRQLHPGYNSRYGSGKWIEKMLAHDRWWGGQIVEILDFKPAYEYRPRQMMVPCRVIKEQNGERKEMYCGVIAYLRQHNGRNSTAVTGYFPRLSDEMVEGKPADPKQD